MQKRPTDMRGLAAVAAALSFVAVAGCASSVRVGGRQGTSPSSTQGDTDAGSDRTALVTSGQAHTVAVHEGDTVRGTGYVVAVPGRPVRFCSPLVFVIEGAPFGACPIGLTVVGADLNDLADRQTRQGVVRGSATITGVYHEGSIEVTDQRAARPGSPFHLGNDSVPCPEPSGGWPTRHASAHRADLYRREHPSAIVEVAYLHPSMRTQIVYLLTAGDPGPVRDALAPAYGDSLCVQQSIYTPAQIAAARDLVMRRIGQHNANALTRPVAGGGIGLGATYQFSTSLTVSMIDEDLAERLDDQPAGLIEIELWLRRVS